MNNKKQTILPNLGLQSREPGTQTVKIITERIPLDQLARNAGPMVRLAGLSGATAVILGAYGSHRKFPPVEKEDVDLKVVFETANRYHFIHTLALLATPLCRAPKTSATFLSAGIILFSGTLYYRAFTGDTKFSKLAPIGGTCLIIGWLAMII
ncbi:transmembrane protein 256 homolog isoform X2 [Chrysoperla carnea]|uniref:transmembrane protein 256 homolog isoform X2 n=1 Tax=Chrysoperla carnea TaxID=189513 RepID=UPI001D0684D8|nr:transmembrane protein 256 homolog isoform X2 [Chrysoperla carnea]